MLILALFDMHPPFSVVGRIGDQLRTLGHGGDGMQTAPLRGTNPPLRVDIACNLAVTPLKRAQRLENARGLGFGLFGS